MTDKDARHEDHALERLFEAARADPPQAPEALIARVLADAQAMQPDAKPTGWRGWLGALGGAPGASGLIAASCVGFWIGVADPEALPDVAALVFGAEQTDETIVDADTSGFGWDVEEG